jgi:predicted DNA-binding transcriptional regulator YafY
MLGLSDVFASVGVGSSLQRTEAKVLAALPEDQRRRAEQSRRRIYVDLSRWWDHAETVPHLPTLVEALLAGRRIRIRYKRGEDQAVVRRTLDPYGLVVQGGTWYLVARPGRREVRTYRVSRVMGAEALDEHSVIPDDFDLPSFWATRKDEFHMSRTGYDVVARVRPWALRALTNQPPHGGGPQIVEAESDGWTTVTLSFEYRGRAFERMLSLGAGAVVERPAELRAGIERAIGDLADVYGVTEATAGGR